jgi:hypothetical protein
LLRHNRPPEVAGILQSMSGSDAERPDGREPTIDELAVADEPERWSALGFSVADGSFPIGTVRVRLIGRDAGRGIVSWSLRAVGSVNLDGLPTTRSDAPTRLAASVHPNGVVALDHIVAMSPALDRTVAALQSAGLKLRRIRELPTPAGAPRQAFFRLGEEILEVVQEPGRVAAQEPGEDRPARLWGLAFTVEDLDGAVKRFGAGSGPVHPAVQRGRKIATLRRSAGLAIPVALMSPRVGPDGAAMDAPGPSEPRPGS